MAGMRSNIPSQLFIPVVSLEWLSLDDGFIPVLTPLIVTNKPKLKYLSLASCKIEAVLDSTFSESQSLEVLILHGNNLKFMTAGQLKGLVGLIKLGTR